MLVGWPLPHQFFTLRYAPPGPRRWLPRLTGPGEAQYVRPDVPCLRHQGGRERQNDQPNRALGATVSAPGSARIPRLHPADRQEGPRRRTERAVSSRPRPRRSSTTPSRGFRVSPRATARAAPMRTPPATPATRSRSEFDGPNRRRLRRWRCRWRWRLREVEGTDALQPPPGSVCLVSVMQIEDSSLSVLFLESLSGLVHTARKNGHSLAWPAGIPSPNHGSALFRLPLDHVSTCAKTPPLRLGPLAALVHQLLLSPLRKLREANHAISPMSGSRPPSGH
jgi:hypothetical protein